MPKTSKIHTLNDLDRFGGTGPVQGGNAATLPNSPTSFLKCCHIPTLPTDDHAKALLERVVREFEPIVKQRSYNVLSVSELCCCNDGLDFDGGGRRKRRKVANNIWGYNQTTFRGPNGKAHTIHLRLRHATDHSRFLPYEDVAGTMAHELAHCEHGPHNDKFYKLMDEILEQHAVLMASKLTMNGRTHPFFAGNGQTLGGNLTLAAARKQQAHSGYKLGGDSSFKQWMTPAEAAVVAAEARRRQKQLRLRGDHCCRPCTIDIDGDDDEKEEASSDDQKMPAKPLKTSSNQNDEDTGGKKHASVRQKPPIEIENLRPTGNKKQKNEDWIDLTLDDTDDEEDCRKAATKMQNQLKNASPMAQWACHKCTFLNKQLALACSICQTERQL